MRVLEDGRRLIGVCDRFHPRNRHPPRSWLGLSLPMHGSYADHIHLWGGRHRGPG